MPLAMVMKMSPADKVKLGLKCSCWICLDHLTASRDSVGVSYPTASASSQGRLNLWPSGIPRGRVIVQLGRQREEYEEEKEQSSSLSLPDSVQCVWDSLGLQARVKCYSKCMEETSTTGGMYWELMVEIRWARAAAMDTAAYPLFRALTPGGFQSTHSHNNTWISVQVSRLIKLQKNKCNQTTDRRIALTGLKVEKIVEEVEQNTQSPEQR